MTGQSIAQQSALTPELRAAYLHLIEHHLGLRLSGDQATCLDEAIRSVLAGSDYVTAHELYAASSTTPPSGLLDTIAAHVTVGETHFFRIAPQIEALRQTVLPEIIGRRSAWRRLRIWSAGCSTGEEPHTLAILLREAVPPAEAWDLDIYATDVNRPALQRAREALYTNWSFRATPAAVRQRYFTPEGKAWRLGDAVRRMVRFAYLNLATDPRTWNLAAEPGIDLILCRNVTIYFTPEAAQTLYRHFAGVLAPGGWLILGPSDPVPALPGLLEPVYLPGAVLWRRAVPGTTPSTVTRQDDLVDAPRMPAPSLPIDVPARPVPAHETDPPPRPTEAPLTAQNDSRTALRVHAEHLARTWPLQVDGHLLLGMIYMDEQAIERAIESLRRATFLDQTHVLAHFNLGRAYLQYGDAARARATLTHARRLLAALPEGQDLPGGGAISAGELRFALEAQLAGLSRSGTP
ncbi:MAG TPA: CheR family methyltransferase [Chloroflexota bacterium]|nr:CheR family methyltransferase [Chloroflexota bacterium]